MTDLDPAAHRNRFAGEDVYVLGSGPTFNHLDPSFFRGKRLVSTNHGSMSVLGGVDYLVTKYHRHAREYVEWWPHIPAVTTRWDLGGRGGTPLGDDAPFIVLDHNVNTGPDWSAADWPAEGEFVATYSTITTAMHWAAHLGAANVIMVGHDCGWIDGGGRIPGYRMQADGEDADGDSPLWPEFDRQSRVVKAELVERYGCNVVSVLPFINANMEGHHWHSFAGDVNG